MTKLLGIRTVYDIDPTKTVRVADVIEDGAILPHSVNISDLLLTDLTSNAKEVSAEDYKSDSLELRDLYVMGMGG